MFKIHSQEEKPKVAIVLSGGGAKGIAHIPLLQALDSLGIVPDLIVGTSMGSAVGGLYAIGYSGDDIAEISKNADWDNILSGEGVLTAISNEEKTEYGRYLLNFDIVKGKPILKNALLKDKNLREFLGSLVFPVYKIENFDDFYIPFRAVATDLVAGEEVILGRGNLSAAIRASISIPGVFEPVKYKETLLIDGGVVNNFPADVAKELGADIIIGSDVSGGLLGPDELVDLTSILFQTSMLKSGLKVEANKKLCNVVLNHIPNLSYSTADFIKAPQIYNEGIIATKQNIKNLSEIAEYLKTFNSVKRIKPAVDSIMINSIKYNGISDNNLEFFKARMDINLNQNYSVQELIKASDKGMGTQFFEQINYETRTENDQTILEITGFEKKPNRISGSLHFDTYQGVGMVVNYTGRNVLGKASRLLVGLDIAEQPKMRIQYQKNIGLKRDYWWNLQTYGQYLEQRFFTNGENGEVLNTRYWQSVAQINKNLNPLKDYVGIDLSYTFNNVNPKLKPSENSNAYDLVKARYETIEISGYYIKNTLNRVFFPTQGSIVLARISRSLMSNVDVEFQEATNLNADNKTNGFFKLNLDYEKRFGFSKNNKNSLIIRSTAGFIFEDSLEDNALNFYNYGQFGFFQLSGESNSNKRYASTFKGLFNGELLTSQFVDLYIACQINPIRKIHFTPYFNAGLVGFNDVDDFFSNMSLISGDWDRTDQTSVIYSLGSTLSYDSLLGPVNLDMAYINGVEKLELFFSVGINLNIQK